MAWATSRTASSAARVGIYCQPLWSTTLFIQLWLARRSAFEATMGPKILLGAFDDGALHPLVDAQAIDFIAFAREVFHCRMYHQPVATAVRQPLLGEGHHKSAAQSDSGPRSCDALHPAAAGGRQWLPAGDTSGNGKLPWRKR